MTREHRRPLMAFVAVALLCALVVGNSMTLASGSSRNLAAEVRAAVAGVTPFPSSDGDTVADEPSLSTVKLVFTPGPSSFDPPVGATPDSDPVTSPDDRPGVVVGPKADDDDSASQGDGAPSTSGSDPTPSNDPTPTAPPSSPTPEPTVEPVPSQTPEPEPSEDSSEVPESDSVLTIDDVTNPDPPTDPEPGDDSESNGSGSNGSGSNGDEPAAGTSLESNAPQGDKPLGFSADEESTSPQDEAESE